jgi:hypothetical protein
MFRSNFNSQELVMMQELLNVTVAPEIEVVGELAGAIKSLVGAAGAPGGGDDSSDSDRKHSKRTPGKDKGKPTAKKKGKHKDDDHSSGSSSSDDDSEESDRDRRRKSKVAGGPAKTLEFFNKKRRETIAPNDHLHPAKFPKSGVLEDMLIQVARPNMTEHMSMYTMKQELTEKELPSLKGKLDVHRVFVFLSKVADVERTTIYPVYIAKHISPTILTVLEHHIQTLKRDRFYAEYEKLKAVKTKRILYGGVQNLTNVEVFKVLKWEIRPKSKAIMKQVLRRSVFPARWFEFFKEESKIRAEPNLYLHVLIHYFDNFDKLMDLVEEGKEFLPTFIIGKREMSGEATGIVDYWLRGCPNVAFAYLVMKEGIAEHMRTEKLTWLEFKEMYMQAFEHYCEEKIVADDTNLRFVKDVDNKPLPPLELEYKKKAYERSHARGSGDVNQVSQHQERDSDYEEPEWSEPPDEDDGYETSPESEQPPPGDPERESGEHKREDCQMESKEDNPLYEMMHDIPEDDLEDETLLLAAAFSDKTKFVCFNFANKGVCNYEKEKGKKCRYSHDPEDVKKYLALKQLGGVRGIRDAAERFGPKKTNPTGGTAGLAGRSPGIRPPLPGSKPTGFGRSSGYSGVPPKRS